MTHTEESLIARLRIPHHTCEPILREAAEALEKAEAENAWLKEAIGVRDAENQRAIDTLKAECERLRSTLFQMQEASKILTRKLEDAEKECDLIRKAAFIFGRKTNRSESTIRAAIDAAMKEQP